jgi:hypothetical protein
MVLIFAGMKNPLKQPYFVSFGILAVGEIERVFFLGWGRLKR